MNRGLPVAILAAGLLSPSRGRIMPNYRVARYAPARLRACGTT
jgi:hypothetical protein